MLSRYMHRKWLVDLATSRLLRNRLRAASRNRQRPTFLATLEQLEERTLLAGIWLSGNAVLGLPITGAAWNSLSAAAQPELGLPNLQDQNENTDVLTLAKALAGVRLQDLEYLTQVRHTIMEVVNSESVDGVVTIADPLSVETTATFSAPGTYLLRLSADDGLLKDEDEITIKVYAAGASFTPTGSAALGGSGQVTFTGSSTGVNASPVAKAGANQAVSVNDTVTIRGTVTDDGLPAGTVVTTWEFVPPRTLAIARNLVSYVIAADLVELEPAQDAVFRTWLRELLSKNIDGRSLSSTQEERPNNWGTMAAASRAAAAVYLGDQAELERTAQVFKGFLGDRSAYAGFDFGVDPSWQVDPNQPLAINAKGATKDGQNIDGAQPEEMRRGGPLQSPPIMTSYPWEGLQGAVVAAEILSRAGYDVWEWQDRALLRAVTYLYGLGWSPPKGHEWIPWIIDARYGTHFAETIAADPGKNMGWTSWTHQFGPPDVNRPPTVNAGLDQTVAAAGIAALQAIVSDDGLPNPPGNITTQWIMFSGPEGSTAQFANATALDTTVTLSKPGNYVLQLTANDGELAASDEIAIRVRKPQEIITHSFQDGLEGYNGTRDTRIREDSPTSNFGSSTKLELDGSPDRVSFVRWDTSTVPVDSTVTAVSITVNVVNSSVVEGFEVYEALRSWDEQTATFELAATDNPWEVFGAAGATDHAADVLGTLTSSTTGLVTFNLNAWGVALAQKWITDPSRNRGIVIQDLDNLAADRLDFSSREAVGLGPRLTLTYTVGPPNNAPLLDDRGDPSLTAIPEDVATSQNPGDTVASVFGSLITDLDPDALTGVAVVGVTGLADGAWEYSNDGGSTWLSLSTASESAARLLTDTARIRFAPQANFAGSASIVVRAWDLTSGTDVADLTGVNATGGTTPYSLAIESATITIIPDNDPPSVSLANTTTTLSELTSTTVRIKVADIVISDDALGTNDLTLSGADAALFEIDGGRLFVKAEAVLNFESNPILDVTVSVDDSTLGSTPDDSASLVINVTVANALPSVSLANTTTTLSESASTTAHIKVADIVISDDAVGTNTLSLSGADAELFEIDGGQLFVKAAGVLDFETNPALDVTVSVDDSTVGSTPDGSAALVIDVTDTNEPPSVSLANTTTTLSESVSTAVRIKVADIVISDDALGTNTLSLSGADAELFEIDGGQLFVQAAAVLDFRTNPVLDVTVSVDDNTLGSTPDGSAALVIDVTQANEPPSVSLANTTTTLSESASTTVRILVADIVISDDAVGTNVLTLGGVDAELFELENGQLFVKAAAVLDFETNPVLDVTVSVDDSTLGSTPDGSAALVIDVTDANEPPSVSLENRKSILSEAAKTTVHIRVADIVIRDDALGMIVLTLGGADAALFEIDAGRLLIKAATVLDFETNPVLDVTVFVDDSTLGSTPDGSAAFVLQLTDANELPSVALVNTTIALSESANTTDRIKVADIVVSDDALGTNILSLSGLDAALFEIDAGQLFVTAATVLDFETHPILEVTVAVDDSALGSTPDGSASFVIQVTDTNEPPSILLANTTTTLSESTSTTVRIKVADIVISDDALGTNDLTLGGADAALFEIDGGQLFVTATAELDFETNPILDVTVSMDDSTLGSTPDGSVSLVIDVTNANEPPSVSLANTTTTLSESTSIIVRIKVADIVISDDALGTNVLTLGGADATLFEIEGGQLFVNAAAVLDFETNPALDVTVSVDDNTLQTTPSGSAALVIQVTDTNEPPSVSILNTTTLSELASTAVRIKMADIVISDDALGTNTLSLSGADATLFEIDEGQLFVTAAAVLDFETNSVLDVTVSVDDNTLGSTPDGSAALVILVTDANEPPSVSIVNRTTTLSESASTAVRIKVADIVISDDALGTNVLALSGTDAALFEIDGGQLFVTATAVLDFETNSALDVTVSVNDSTVGSAPDDSKSVVILVTDTNEPPAVSLANTTTAFSELASTTVRIKVADIVISDDALGTNVLALSGTDAALFEIDGGQLFVTAAAVLDFETNLVLDVTVSVDDNTVGSTPDGSAALVILVTNANEPPSVSLVNTTTILSESASSAVRIKMADIVISDDALGTNSLSLSGADATLFEIDGGQLFLKAAAVLDFETNSVLDVTVSVDDNTLGSTHDGSAASVINVIDANEPPSVSIVNRTTTLSELASTAVRIKVADIVISDDVLGTNTLSLSGADATLFEIDGGQLFVKAAAVLDFEANSVLDVTVSVDDTTLGSTPDGSAALMIDVIDANERPSVSFANSTTALSESVSTTFRIKMADIVISDDALGTNVLALNGADAALFEIDGGQLFVKAATVLDFETNPVLDVTVSVDDNTLGSTPDGSAASVIHVTDANEPPSVTLVNTTMTFSESANTTVRIKVAEIVISDDALGTNTLSLSGADATLLEIDGGQLFVKAGVVLDFETNPVLDVTVSVDDSTVGSAPDGSSASVIHVTDANEPPSVTLANTTMTLAESVNTTVRIKVADIVISDDALGTNTLNLNGVDAALLEIDGGQLFVKAGAVLDFETNPVLAVTVSVVDSTVGSAPDGSAASVIHVTDANEPPSVTLVNTTMTLSESANTTVRIKMADIVISDDALGTNILTLGGSDAALFEIDGGQLFVQAAAVLDFETNPVLDVMVSVEDSGTVIAIDAVARLIINVTDMAEWQNPQNRNDIVPDGFLVPLDALVVINELNNPRFSDPVTRKLQSQRPTQAYFYDLTGDDFATPQDALIVINELNRRSLGEGEFSTTVLENLILGPSAFDLRMDGTAVEESDRDLEKRMRIVNRYHRTVQPDGALSSSDAHFCRTSPTNLEHLNQFFDLFDADQSQHDIADQLTLISAGRKSDE